MQWLIPTRTTLASRMSLHRETSASYVHAPTFLSTRLLRSTTGLEKTRKVYAIRRHSRSLCLRRWPNIHNRPTELLQRMQVQVLPCHATMPRHAAHSTQPKFQRLEDNIAKLLDVCFLQRNSLCKNCFGYQEICPYNNLLLVRGTTAVRMQWVVTNGVILTSRLSLHRVSLHREFTTLWMAWLPGCNKVLMTLVWKQCMDCRQRCRFWSKAEVPLWTWAPWWVRPTRPCRWRTTHQRPWKTRYVTHPTVATVLIQNCSMP